MAFEVKTLADVTVTTDGTRVRVSATDLWVYSFNIQAKPSNTGKIYVGDSDVAAGRGHELGAGESYGGDGLLWPRSLEEVNLKDVWIDSSVSGEKVKVTYIRKRST